jgi:5-methylcytosine-specific restriction endonuclease McrA
MTAKNGKPCKKCGTSAWRKSGHCIECEKQNSKQWRENNPEKRKEIQRRYKKRNPEKVKESQRKYHEKNPEAANKWKRENPELAKQRNKEWREKNKQKIRQKKRIYETENKEKINKKSLERYYKNKEKWQQRTTNWRRRNPDKVAAANHKRRNKIKNNGGNYTDYEWKKLCKQYEYRCIACGKKTKLTVDHVIPLDLGGANTIDNIQPLCKSCNSSKGTKTIDYRNKPIIERWIQKRLIN